MKYDYLIYIGRFQPVHRGHVHVIREALKLTKKLIIVLGSHKKAIDTRNPFNTQERMNFINMNLSPTEVSNIVYSPQYDYTYNDDRWIASIQASVNTITLSEYTPDKIKVGLVGYEKDHSSYYLKKFPFWELVEIEPINIQHSTDFRKTIFENAHDDASGHYIIARHKFEHFCESETYANALSDWIYKSLDFKYLKEEYEFVKKYKQQWESSPYPPTFVTVDGVIVQSGHILLVSRKEQPGAGLYALPGGFVNQNETLEEAILREVYEETRLDIPKPVLKGSLVSRRTFDEPNRSQRGRTITECFYFRLNEAHKLPKVKGSDDADKAFWLPFSEIQRNRDSFFEDHYSIIENMIGI